jgi:hypothetical protein
MYVYSCLLVLMAPRLVGLRLSLVQVYLRFSLGVFTGTPGTSPAPVHARPCWWPTNRRRLQAPQRSARPGLVSGVEWFN